MAGSHSYSMRRRSILLAVLSVISLARLSSATCYDHNSKPLGPEFQPCSNVAGEVSMCCATNRKNPAGGMLANGVTSERCLPNGLCQAESFNETSKARSTDYWRNGCTANPVDKTKCLADVCVGKSDSGNAQGSAALTPCDGTPTSEFWCCAKNSTACCSTDQKIRLPAILGQSASASSSPAVASPTSQPASSPAAAAPRAGGPKPLSPGAILAISLAIIVVLGAFIGTIVVLTMRKNERRKAERGQGASTADGTGAGAGPPEYYRSEASALPLSQGYNMHDKPLPNRPMPALGYPARHSRIG
ncbi:hypothetical protein CC80DRAFT_535760 [Byssothecium circinans]|uniref:Mid2 domain-containing protein n=1 Tax=Byssothecium circinans TaxID=147558 RepID=A0A6A5TSN4_9PLEO|nr:hypothetical protein CC80DRAFT_535760 [Byssothecium circinans]